MRLKSIKNIFIALVINLFIFTDAWARAGGGGSASSGASTGSGIIRTAPSGSAESISAGNTVGLVIVMFSLIAGAMIYVAYKRKKKIAAAEGVVSAAAASDEVWNQERLVAHAKDVFEKFQRDWSDFNIDAMQAYLSAEYLKRMVLEMNVLKNEERKNSLENVDVKKVTIMEAIDESDNSKDCFTAEISAKAHDTLVKTDTGEILASDDSLFTEFWTFVRQENEWRLDVIKQKTENHAWRDLTAEKFAEKNNFFYDPDFGWLMLPDKGVAFGGAKFKTSDINDHVIGYFRDKIVEFYKFTPDMRVAGAFGQAETTFVVAQAILPKKYGNIFVRKIQLDLKFIPSNLKRVKTESNAFEKKFCVYATEDDQVNSFELLTPNFMEKIEALPFDVNIEVVGNFLYVYVHYGLLEIGKISYDQMLEVLSWAFDEMER